MRALLLAFLATSTLAVATPAMADPDEASRDQIIERIQAAREERAQARQDARDQRIQERSLDRPTPGWERPREETRPVRVDPAERVEAPVSVEVRAPEPPLRPERPRPTIRDVAAGIEGAREDRDSVRDWRRADRERRRSPALPVEVQPPLEGRAPVAGQPPSDRRLGDRRWEDRRDRDARRPGFGELTDRVAREGWRRDWRRDRRYDWRRHRDQNRDLFRWGFYYDPFGWRYRPWEVGRTIYRPYYSSRYWISDPWRYRLPVVYGPYRWIRYYDDALLVDLRTGRVVDVIRNFFW